MNSAEIKDYLNQNFVDIFNKKDNSANWTYLDYDIYKNDDKEDFDSKNPAIISVELKPIFSDLLTKDEIDNNILILTKELLQNKNKEAIKYFDNPKTMLLSHGYPLACSNHHDEYMQSNFLDAELSKKSLEEAIRRVGQIKDKDGKQLRKCRTLLVSEPLLYLAKDIFEDQDIWDAITNGYVVNYNLKSPTFAAILTYTPSRVPLTGMRLIQKAVNFNLAEEGEKMILSAYQEYSFHFLDWRDVYLISV
jgi:tRNA A37 threonylcarbamoyladenosine biosynthesis protein TsaE